MLSGLSIRQRAALAAMVLHGEAWPVYAVAFLARAFGVSGPYVAAAAVMSPQIRLAEFRGGHIPLAPRKTPLALPVPGSGNGHTSISDNDLIALGPERLLDAAVVAEQQQNSHVA
jgi:hypothetical protein